jgi:hypothetical protein
MTARTWIFVIDFVIHADTATMTDDGAKYLRIILFALINDNMHMVEIAFPAPRTSKSV